MKIKSEQQAIELLQNISNDCYNYETWVSSDVSDNKDNFYAMADIAESVIVFLQQINSK